MITLKGTHLTQSKLNSEASYKDKGVIREPFFIVVSLRSATWRSRFPLLIALFVSPLQGLGKSKHVRLTKAYFRLIPNPTQQLFSNCSLLPPTCRSPSMASLGETTTTTGITTATCTAIVRSLNEVVKAQIVTMDMGITIVNRRMGGIMGVTTTIITEATITVQMFSCIVSGLVSFHPYCRSTGIPMLMQPRYAARVYPSGQSAHNTVCSGGRSHPHCLRIVSAMLMKFYRVPPSSPIWAR
jgi:hypothetical protein